MKDTPVVQSLLRELPSVDQLLRTEQAKSLIAAYGPRVVTDAVRTALDEARHQLLRGALVETPTSNSLLHQAEETLTTLFTPSLRPVINASGVIIHTNLGRAPLSTDAVSAMVAIAAGYSTLEYDLEAGERGSRTIHPELLLTRLTGAESALVVNNNAAAVLLMLTALCRGREVIVSRGELVEIGGGFRIPEVLAQSGAIMKEIGTTNRTHMRDYTAAITDQTAAILVTHYSNYKIIGFTSHPEIAELAALARQHDILLLFDQGSGILIDVTPYGLEAETTVVQGLAAGCDVVAFSGDKMLGGPQSGILVGRKQLIDQLKQHPLARAVRADKLCLAALTTTLSGYLFEDAQETVPVLQMISRTKEDILAEADWWAEQLNLVGISATIKEGESRVGGGSLPGTSLPTYLVAIEPRSMGVDELAAALRVGTMPVIGSIQDDRLLLDPRTVLPGQANDLIEAVIQACGRKPQNPSTQGKIN